MVSLPATPPPATGPRPVRARPGVATRRHAGVPESGAPVDGGGVDGRSAPGGGFEPPLTEPKSVVLPLDDPGSVASGHSRDWQLTPETRSQDTDLLRRTRAQFGQ